MLSRLTMSAFGALMLVYGIVAAFSPLPAGAPFCVFGLMFIAAGNPSARPAIRRLRRRWPWFNALVKTFGKAGPKAVREAVSETEPKAASKTEDRH